MYINVRNSLSEFYANMFIEYSKRRKSLIEWRPVSVKGLHEGHKKAGVFFKYATYIELQYVSKLNNIRSEDIHMNQENNAG